jgi:hypothetical protein
METQLSNYKIDLLTPDLVDWFINVACVGMLVNEVKRPELVNLPHLATLTKMVMDQGTAFVVHKDGIYMGAIAGIVAPSIYNPTIKVCNELFWYVLPEFRNTRTGLLLLNALIKRGEELADETLFSLLAGSTVNDKSLERKGFSFSESGFIRYNKE